jgi:hypothetical protein
MICSFSSAIPSRPAVVDRNRLVEEEGCNARFTCAIVGGVPEPPRTAPGEVLVDLVSRDCGKRFSQAGHQTCSAEPGMSGSDTGSRFVWVPGHGEASILAGWGDASELQIRAAAVVRLSVDFVDVRKEERSLKPLLRGCEVAQWVRLPRFRLSGDFQSPKDQCMRSYEFANPAHIQQAIQAAVMVFSCMEVPRGDSPGTLPPVCAA